jgi:hypothetical protein
MLFARLKLADGWTDSWAGIKPGVRDCFARIPLPLDTKVWNGKSTLSGPVIEEVVFVVVAVVDIVGVRVGPRGAWDCHSLSEAWQQILLGKQSFLGTCQTRFSLSFSKALSPNPEKSDKWKLYCITTVHIRITLVSGLAVRLFW